MGWYTHNECLWVQWCEYVHELKDGMFYSTRRSRVEWNIPAFNEWTYSHHCTNEKHSLFVLYNIQVDLCHFDWKTQLSKQTKRRPTIFDSIIRMLVVLVILLILFLAVTLLRYKDAHAVMFLLSFFVPSEKYHCTLAACNGTFRMERKSTVSDSACNGTFICYHVTDNPPIKWQGSAWVLYNRQ